MGINTHYLRLNTSYLAMIMITGFHLGGDILLAIVLPTQWNLFANKHTTNFLNETLDYESHYMIHSAVATHWTESNNPGHPFK